MEFAEKDRVEQVNVETMLQGARRPADREDFLDSWKEISLFLKRGIRTVQRWEATEGLPVHRHRHLKRGTVFAFASEIDGWLKTRDSGKHLGDDAISEPNESELPPAKSAA